MSKKRPLEKSVEGVGNGGGKVFGPDDSSGMVVSVFVSDDLLKKESKYVDAEPGGEPLQAIGNAANGYSFKFPGPDGVGGDGGISGALRKLSDPNVMK
eukprot:590758-Rhodomonas_salina.1